MVTRDITAVCSYCQTEACWEVRAKKSAGAKAAWARRKGNV